MTIAVLALNLMALVAREAATGSLVDLSPSAGPVSASVACGPASLSMAARLVHVPISNQRMHEIMGGNLTGNCSLADLQKAATSAGLETAVVRLNPRNPPLLHLPLIVSLRARGWKDTVGHFVVLSGRVDDRMVLIDFPNPPILVRMDVLAKRWDGVGLYIAAPDDNRLAPAPDPSRSISLGIAVAALLLLTVTGVRVGYRKFHSQRQRGGE